MALVVKLTRTAMIGALEQDYVTFARARGVPRRARDRAHALRNALVPSSPSAGLVLDRTCSTGAVLVETTFALPGLGTLLVESVEFKDMPMLQGVAMLVAALDRHRQPAASTSSTRRSIRGSGSGGRRA